MTTVSFKAFIDGKFECNITADYDDIRSGKLDFTLKELSRFTSQYDIKRECVS